MVALDPRGRMMAAEIAEQPAVLRRLNRGRRAILDDLAGATSGVRSVAVLGRGSSANAGAVVRPYFESAGVAVSMVDVDDFDGHRAMAYGGHLVIALSQSGQTAEVVDAVRTLRAQGASTIAITNDPGSALSSAADVHVALEAGPERAVPATKTFVAQVVALALVAESLGAEPVFSLEPLAVGIERDLLDSASVDRAASLLADVDGGVVIGAGPLAAAASEVALKMTETTGAPWSAQSSVEVLHGPMAACREGRGLIALVGDDHTGETTEALLPRIAERGSTVVRIGGSAADLPTSIGVNPALAVLAVVRGQVLAHRVALSLGFDPDRPHGLSKVTASNL